MGRKKGHPIIEQLLITDIGAEGKAIAKTDNMVVFVPHAVPGDVVDVQIIKKRHSYMEGRVINFRTLSEKRTQPQCKYFGICGGCKWQDLPYNLQLHYKEKQVHDQLVRIGHLNVPQIEPIIPSQLIYQYRNKLEFTFSNKGWLTKEQMEDENIVATNALGFHIPGLFDKVLDIESCHLQNNKANELFNIVRQFAKDNDIPFFDLKAHTGFLRTMVIRSGANGQMMLILTFAYEDETLRKSILDHIIKNCPNINSLMYVINSKPHDNFADLPVELYYGTNHIIEEMDGLKFKVGPKSFYQTNSLQAFKLYSVVREMANLTGEECVYDLYTGTGTIANFLARKAKKVIGIEYVEDAIKDAIYNSRLNAIDNTVFYAGDMKDVLSSDFIDKHGIPDVMVLDPPRAGVHNKVIEAIKYAKSPTLIYVSCNPATQARDLALLSDMYRVEKVQPVDMFPHTHHVESVCLLSRL